jgi:hypothetical protein
MPCGKESSPRIAIDRKLLTEEPSCEAVDMTALETFTNSFKGPLTTGRRPEMIAICAFETFERRLESTKRGHCGWRRCTSQLGGKRAYAGRLGKDRSRAIAVIPLRARNRLHCPERPSVQTRLWIEIEMASYGPGAFRFPIAMGLPISARASAGTGAWSSEPGGKETV